MKRPKHVVVLEAVDWSMFSDQVGADYDFKAMRGWVCGFLVKETGKYITLTQQWFAKENQVRQTITIPKANIKTRFNIEDIHAADDGVSE